VKINTALQRMREGKPAIGAGMVLGSPVAGEFLTRLGFDFVMVDTQHGVWSDQDVIAAFRSISLGPAVPMARVLKNDFGAIGRLLDIGALGIIVPMVNSVEEAEAAARAVRYPPRGGRSSGPVGASFHGASYRDWINDQVFLAVQIESRRAVERAEEILAVNGVDGCWIGPSDLGLSMGVDLNLPQDQAAHREAILKVLDACRKTNKIPGIACTPENAGEWIDRGFLFVTAGGDLPYMLLGARDTLNRLGRPAEMF